MAFVLAVLVAVVFPVLAAQAQPAKEDSGVAAFARLKALEGTWVGRAGEAGGETIDATASYRVTSGGSAVMETLFPGTPHEMVTMYTLDRGVVVLTHYCTMGNQPRMRARRGGSPDELVFDFAGGANIDPKRDGHMHDLRLVFVGTDHIRGEWRSWKDGKPGGTAAFDMTRRP
jgi:hypothetical protein